MGRQVRYRGKLTPALRVILLLQDCDRVFKGVGLRNYHAIYSTFSPVKSPQTLRDRGDRRMFRRSGVRVRAQRTCTSVQPPAAERRLMVWPPSAQKGRKRRIACLFDWGRN